jgi:iron complex outermembrane receptor protein
VKISTSALAGISVLALSSAAYAQDAASEPVAKGDEIIVTGTRATTRTVVQSLAPIDVLSATDLQSSGKQSVRDLLGTLVPSISISNSGAGASFAVKTLSLRGLSGDQVLVLVNGKRRHNTSTLFINGTTQNGQSPPDLDLIPASSIARIEVLRDGASAQYGSDAIAGVINLILRDSDEGGDANALIGETYNGGGRVGQGQGVIGMPLGDGGHVDFAADGRIQGMTFRGGPNQTVLYPLVSGQLDPRESTANRYTSHPGQPRVKTLDLSYDASLPLTDDIKLYSFSTGSLRRSDAFLTFRNPNASNNISEVYPDGYSPELHVNDRDYQVAVGVKGGGLMGFDWDLSSTYGYNQARYHEDGLNASLGPTSPKSFYIGKVTATEWTNNADFRREFEVGTAKPLLVDLGGEYRRNTYSIGAGDLASYVDGGYRSTTGTFANIARVAGAQGVTGFPASAAGTFRRSDVAAYADVEDTIVTGWDVALAGRYEHYSDAGDTTTGKASTRVEPIDGLAFRATISTGFRAPTLQQQHYASSSTIGVVVNGVSVLLPVQALPVDSPAAIALGAAPLKPEKSTNISGGIVFTAIPRLNVTVDAYQIKIRDRILLSGTLSGAAVNTALAAAGITTATSGFYFSNAASTRTRGLDVVATYRAGLGDFGSAVLTASGNINHTIFTSIDQPPAALAAAGLVLIDRARQGDFTHGTPRNKEILSAAWTLNKLGATLRATRYGRVTQTSTLPANDDQIPPKVIFDLDASYAVTENIKFTIGANNLFNIYPPVLKLANRGQTTNSALAVAAGLPALGATNTAYYNSYSPYGVSGGFYYARVNLTF